MPVSRISSAPTEAAIPLAHRVCDFAPAVASTSPTMTTTAAHVAMLASRTRLAQRVPASVLRASKRAGIDVWRLALTQATAARAATHARAPHRSARQDCVPQRVPPRTSLAALRASTQQPTRCTAEDAMSRAPRPRSARSPFASARLGRPSAAGNVCSCRQILCIAEAAPTPVEGDNHVRTAAVFVLED